MPPPKTPVVVGKDLPLKDLPVLKVDKTKVLSSIEIIEAMRGLKPKPGAAVGGRLSNALQKLLDKPPVLKGQATQRFDGRTIPVVVAIVRDQDGVTRAGLLVRLVQDGELKDHTRTNARGIALLRLPRPKQGTGDLKGQLEVLAPGITPKQLDVTVPGGQQHIIKEIVFAELPPPAAATAGDDEDGDKPKVQALLATGKASIPIQDNPLDRLPADFSTDLCADLTQLLGAGEDPILGQLGSATDFRRRKVPLVKRVTIPRIGDNPPDLPGPPVQHIPPRRYLVRVRQQWTPLGYTLGELANVDALDPGAIINEATDTVQHLTDRVARTLDTVTSQALDTTTSTLRQASSIDSLLDIATRTEAFAIAGGFGLPLIGGIGAAYGKVATNASTTSRVDTSLLINSSLQVARSAVNQALRTSVTQLRDVQNTVTRVLGQISPLLSKVTNLLRWTLYENYIVCTHVEDVVEVQVVKLLDQLPAVGSGAHLFTDEEIVEYRRLFEPRLLEPRLASHFETLRRAVALKRAATLPVSVVHMSFDYSAVFAGADLTISVGGDSRIVTLRPGGSRVYESFRLQTPQTMPLAGTTAPALFVTITLNVRADLGRFNFPGFNIDFPGSVTLSHANFRLESSPGVSLERYMDLGTAMRVTTDGSTVAAEILSVQVPPPAVYTDGDPLFVHIDNNRHYYYGVLAQAALVEPALRDDARLLRDVFPSDHDLWRLPIIGFEGDHALVISDPDLKDDQVGKDVTRFLADQGAATLIQLAAPGAYAEALEGLLSLTDAVGKLHPNLLPPPTTLLTPVLPLTSGLAGGTGALPIGGGALGGTGTGGAGGVGGVGGTGGTGTGGTGGLGGLGGLGGGLPTP